MTKLLVVHLPPFHLRRNQEKEGNRWALQHIPPPTELCVFGGYIDIQNRAFISITCHQYTEQWANTTGVSTDRRTRGPSSLLHPAARSRGCNFQSHITKRPSATTTTILIILNRRLYSCQPIQMYLSICACVRHLLWKKRDFQEWPAAVRSSG